MQYRLCNGTRQRFFRLFCIAIPVFLLFLTGCGGGGSGSSTSLSAENGSVAFEVEWQDSSQTRQVFNSVQTLEYEGLDCDAAGIDTVEAEVYDSDGNLLANGGPWDCELHTGTILDVLAGENRFVVILAKSDGETIFRGEFGPVTVTVGETTDIGTIIADTFTLKPVMPSPDAVYTQTELADKMSEEIPFFEATTVPGASQYHLQVATDGVDFKSLVIDEFSETPVFVLPFMLEDAIYYWRIRAKDQYDHAGEWIAARRFTVSTPAEILLSAQPVDILADGETVATILVIVKDGRGIFAMDGTTVTFQTTAGFLDVDQAIIEDGKATVKLTSATDVGPAIVTAAVDAVSETLTINFLALPAHALFLETMLDTLPADGSSKTTLTVMVKDENDAPVIDGTTVLFTATAGTLDATSATTVNGVASVGLTSSTAESVAQVTATVGGVSDIVSITFLPLGANALTLSASPGDLPADGVSASTITATVTDELGAPVADGTVIAFSATSGSLSNTSGVTVNGTVSVQLASAVVAGSAVVTATAGDVSATTTIIFLPLGVSSVNVSVDPAELPADGVSICTIAATVADELGNPVADGTPVAFSTTAGALSAASATTVNGAASVQLTSAMEAGDAIVTATVGELSATTTIRFLAQGAATIALSAEPLDLPADGLSTSTISAVVDDQNGDHVADGTLVTFTTTAGTLDAASAETIGGVATVTLTSAGISGSAIITAAVGDVSGEITVNFSAIVALDLSADLADLLADGVSTSTIEAIVKDENGNDVADGTLVTFSTTAGSLESTSVATIGGIAVTVLTSSDTAQTASVSVAYGEQSKDINVVFHPFIPDTNFEAAIRDAIGKSTGFITLEDLQGLTSFSADMTDITSIQGIKYMENLVILNLASNMITDIAELAFLTQLEALSLDENALADISALFGLTNLLNLSLRYNNIDDLSPLADLTHIKELYLSNNLIVDLEPLFGLISLETLFLDDNAVATINALSGLTNLRVLDLGNVDQTSPFAFNRVQDIDPLVGLIHLEELYLLDNEVQSLEALTDNDGIGSGDIVELRNNPLDTTACEVKVPMLEARGVEVRHNCIAVQ